MQLCELVIFEWCAKKRQASSITEATHKHAHRQPEVEKEFIWCVSAVDTRQFPVLSPPICELFGLVLRPQGPLRANWHA